MPIGRPQRYKICIAYCSGMHAVTTAPGETLDRLRSLRGLCSPSTLIHLDESNLPAGGNSVGAQMPNGLLSLWCSDRRISRFRSECKRHSSNLRVPVGSGHESFRIA